MVISKVSLVVLKKKQRATKPRTRPPKREGSSGAVQEAVTKRK
jgi:hypothetical protein